MKSPVITLHSGDCLTVMDTLPPDHFDAAVTDPPYHLLSIVKRFGNSNAAAAQHGTDGNFARSSKGFMGKEWDGGDIAFRPDTWARVMRVLKPGAHLVAFNHSRTWHRMAIAIEDAGFEIRDSLMWLYGSGFPKSHDIAKALEKLGAPQEVTYQWLGWGTALKPGFEPIVLARKPLAEKSIARQIQVSDTGALHIDAARIPAIDQDALAANFASTRTANPRQNSVYNAHSPDRTNAKAHPGGRWPANVLHDGSPEVFAKLPLDKPGGQSVSRFFYCAKASKAERKGSEHPTVKPQALMRWLIRLITPPGGHILDPFGGSGSTGWAAFAEGVNCDLIERDLEYQADIARGIAELGRAPPDLSAPAPDALPGQESLFPD